MTAPFGALAPSPFEEAIRRAASGLSNNAVGKRAASLLLRAAGGKSGRAFDVPVFGTERARLHPYDNISEKRVFITPQFWEAAERGALAKFIRGGSGDFRFLDVGANAGLYTLFARSEARASGRPFHAICIEPAPEMLSRLRFNLEASGAAREARVVACAVGARQGAATFSVNERNRGESRIAPRGGLEVEVRTLAAIIDEAEAPRIDAMKIDIEGGEAAALEGLFAGAGGRFRPAFIIMEMSHSDTRASAMLAREDYREIMRAGRNGVFARA